MEISAKTRADLIEAVRTARTVVDTGWPRDPATTPDIAQMENFLRANLVNVVASRLIFAMDDDDSPRIPTPVLPQLPDATMDLIRQVMDNQALLDGRLKTQSDSIDSLLESLTSIVGKLGELQVPMDELAEMARSSMKSEES